MVTWPVVSGPLKRNSTMVAVHSKIKCCLMDTSLFVLQIRREIQEGLDSQT